MQKNTNIYKREGEIETYNTGIEPEVLKSKHKEVVKALAGLTVAQAALVLDIVREDIVANAIISN